MLESDFNACIVVYHNDCLLMGRNGYTVQDRVCNAAVCMRIDMAGKMRESCDHVMREQSHGHDPECQ